MTCRWISLSQETRGQWRISVEERALALDASVDSTMSQPEDGTVEERGRIRAPACSAHAMSHPALTSGRQRLIVSKRCIEC